MTTLTVLHLLIAYAICFGIQNKATFLYSKNDLLDKLLACTYCLGFHCGWVTWLLSWAVLGTTPAEGLHIIPSLILWSMASAAFCYAMDAVVRWLESNTGEG